MMNRKLKMFLSSISPSLMTHMMFLYNFKRPLNLKKPHDINEKLQYLKLKTYYNNPVITQCVDKYRVRDYMEQNGYGSIMPKLLAGGYKDLSELRREWDSFPQKFVIKCNHGCGYNILVTDKDSVNIDEVICQLNKWMKEDFWKIFCEPQYKFVDKRILVEEYLADDIMTYKFYCFHGSPEVVYVSLNGENGEKDLYLDYYDMNWNWLPITLDGHQHYKQTVSMPKGFQKMVELAKELSKPFPFVRIDLYNVDGKVYFSEFTFIPTGGNMKLTPVSVIDEWGQKLRL